jgi:hypothetical protein
VDSPPPFLLSEDDPVTIVLSPVLDCTELVKPVVLVILVEVDAAEKPRKLIKLVIETKFSLAPMMLKVSLTASGLGSPS